MRAELRRSMPLLFLFAIGLGAGVWIFVSPWVLGYPLPGTSWTGAVWTSVWVGGILTAVSAASLVTLLARALHLAQRAEPHAE